MSYILNALKKSEKERQRGTVPDPLTMQDFNIWTPRNRRVWTYLIIIAFVVNAGVFIWWLDPWKAKNPINPVQSSADKKSQVSLSDNTSSPQGEQTKESQRTDLPAGRRVKEDKTVKTKQGSHDSSVNTPTKSRVNEPIPLHEQESTESPKGETKNTIREIPIKNKIYNMNELPSSILQKLPSINISIALYSDDPSTRMARINGKTLQEGQYLADGLRLEEITHGSVVFSYHGFRFRVGLH